LEIQPDVIWHLLEQAKGAGVAMRDLLESRASTANHCHRRTALHDCTAMDGSLVAGNTHAEVLV